MPVSASDWKTIGSCFANCFKIHQDTFERGSIPQSKITSYEHENTDTLKRKQFVIRIISALFEIKRKFGIVHFPEMISDFVTLHCSQHTLPFYYVCSVSQCSDGLKTNKVVHHQMALVVIFSLTLDTSVPSFLSCQTFCAFGSLSKATFYNVSYLSLVFRNQYRIQNNHRFSLFISLLSAKALRNFNSSFMFRTAEKLMLKIMYFTF